MKRNKYSRLNIYYHKEYNKYLFYDKDADKSYLYDEDTESPNHFQPLGLNSDLIALYARKNNYDIICYMTADGEVIVYKMLEDLKDIITKIISYGEKLSGLDKDSLNFFHKLTIANNLI